MLKTPSRPADAFGVSRAATGGVSGPQGSQRASGVGSSHRPERGQRVLARIRKAMEEKEEGFTLIELLVVIIIIGILAAIAIPVFLNQRKKAVDSSLKSDLRTVANELETFYTDNQAYPVAANVTQASPGADVVIAAGDTVKVSTLNFMKLYKVNGAGTGYCVQMTNAKGTDSVNGYWYDSTAGGLKSACSF